MDLTLHWTAIVGSVVGILGCGLSLFFIFFHIHCQVRSGSLYTLKILVCSSLLLSILFVISLRVRISADEESGLPIELWQVYDHLCFVFSDGHVVSGPLNLSLFPPHSLHFLSPHKVPLRPSLNSDRTLPLAPGCTSSHSLLRILSNGLPPGLDCSSHLVTRPSLSLPRRTSVHLK